MKRTVFHPNGVREVVTLYPCSTTRTLTGAAEAVEVRKAALMREYPPEGYGTTAKQVGQFDGPDGFATVVEVWHANSCD